MGVPLKRNTLRNSTIGAGGPFRARRAPSLRHRGGTIQQVRLPTRLELDLAQWLGEEAEDPIPAASSQRGVLPRSPTPPARPDHPSQGGDNSDRPESSQAPGAAPDPFDDFLLSRFDWPSSPESMTTLSGERVARHAQRRRRSLSPRSRPQLRRTNAVRYPPVDLDAGRPFENEDDDEQVQSDINRMRDELLAVRRYWRTMALTNQSTTDISLGNVGSRASSDASIGAGSAGSAASRTGVQLPVQIAEQDLPPPANYRSRVCCQVLKVMGRRDRFSLRRRRRIPLGPGMPIAPPRRPWEPLPHPSAVDPLLSDYPISQFIDEIEERRENPRETVNIARPLRHDRFPMSDERSGHRHVHFVTDDDGRVHIRPEEHD